jgi:hypothetical protein
MTAYQKGNNMIREFIESVRDEKNGFSFDEPWRLEEKSLGVVIPIKRKSKAKRNYITLPEAKSIKVEDTGQIDYVYVKNDEEQPVLISRGEIFRGKTQERAAIHDHIVMPGKGLRVSVRCIHKSKGINSTAEMKYGGRTPYDVKFTSQSTTWDSVNNYSSTVRSFVDSHVSRSQTLDDGPATFTSHAGSSDTTYLGNVLFANTFDAGVGIPGNDDLVSTMDSLVDSIKEAMKKIPPIKDQVGAAFFVENDLKGMDVYDLPDSWDAIKEEVISKEGSNFMKKSEEDMFTFKPEMAGSLLKKKMSVSFEEKEIYQDGNYRLVEIKADNLIGEVIVFKEKVLHLTLWSKN